jgi:hypothetical protein
MDAAATRSGEKRDPFHCADCGAFVEPLKSHTVLLKGEKRTVCGSCLEAAKYDGCEELT